MASRRKRREKTKATRSRQRAPRPSRPAHSKTSLSDESLALSGPRSTPDAVSGESGRPKGVGAKGVGTSGGRSRAGTEPADGPAGLGRSAAGEWPTLSVARNVFARPGADLGLLFRSLGLGAAAGLAAAAIIRFAMLGVAAKTAVSGWDFALGTLVALLGAEWVCRQFFGHAVRAIPGLSDKRGRSEWGGTMEAACLQGVGILLLLTPWYDHMVLAVLGFLLRRFLWPDFFRQGLVAASIAMLLFPLAILADLYRWRPGAGSSASMVETRSRPGNGLNPAASVNFQRSILFAAALQGLGACVGVLVCVWMDSRLHMLSDWPMVSFGLLSCPWFGASLFILLTFRAGGGGLTLPHGEGKLSGASG